MAKVVITIEDNIRGGVDVSSTPDKEELLRIAHAQDGTKIKPAEAVAFHLINSYYALLKKFKNKDRILVDLPAPLRR